MRGLLITLIATVSMWAQVAEDTPPHLPTPGSRPFRSSRSIRRRASSASACSRAPSRRARRCRSRSPASAPWPRRRRRTGTYGPKAIALLEQGLSPAEVVKRITDEDPGRDTRQVAVIDTKGRSAVYTGKHVIERNFDPKDLGALRRLRRPRHRPNFSVQGNTLASEAVVKAMAEAYEKGNGLDGRAADGRARRRAVEGRRHARDAVGRDSRRAGRCRRTRSRRSNGSSTSGWTMRRTRSWSCGGCSASRCGRGDEQPALHAERRDRRDR